METPSSSLDVKEETVTKKEAIVFLREQGWTKADAERALDALDFSATFDRLSILQAASRFAGTELINRQRLQAAQKGQVTRKQKELAEKEEKIHDLVKQIINLRENPSSEELAELQGKLKDLETDRDNLLASKDEMEKQTDELKKVNDLLMKDNRQLRNLLDQIRLKVAQETKSLLRYQDSEIRQAVIRLFQKTIE